MKLYEDEWLFWDDMAGKHIMKYASSDGNASEIAMRAGITADLMVLERRKRKRVKLVESEVSAALAATLALVGRN